MTPCRRLCGAVALLCEAGLVTALAALGGALRLPEPLAQRTVVPWLACIERRMRELI